MVPHSILYLWWFLHCMEKLAELLKCQSLHTLLAHFHYYTTTQFMKQWISHFSGTIWLLLLQYSVLKAKPYHWPVYNIITIMAPTFWHTSEALVRAGNVTAYTCVAHAYKFFSICMCTLQCMPTVSNRICVYKYLNRATLAVVTLCTDMASALVGITDRTYWTLWRWCPAKLLLLQHITLCQCWNTNKISGNIFSSV